MNTMGGIELNNLMGYVLCRGEWMSTRHQTTNEGNEWEAITAAAITPRTAHKKIINTNLSVWNCLIERFYKIRHKYKLEIIHIHDW